MPVKSALPSRAKTNPHVKTRMTVVRIAVARLGFTSATPTLARIAVSAANNAERKAQTNQFPVMGRAYVVALKSREGSQTVFKKFRHPELVEGSASGACAH